MEDYNLVLDTDSYKASHWLQYPTNTTRVFSYIESRGGRHPETVFFGLQYLLKKLSKQIKWCHVVEAEEFYKAHGEPFNLDGWIHVVNDHDGFLPLKIKAVPEGTIVPTSNVLCTVENTCDKCFWLTSWVETMLLRVWYPTTVATESRYIKKIILDYLKQSSDDPEGEIAFKLHDFGSRGVSSLESAALGGAAHLVNFMGSDTVPGVLLANRTYKSKMAGFSIPAAEHSTITSWGREHEAEAYKNMLAHFAKPGSLVACVSDSYDIYNACEKIWGEQLREQVINSGATVVIRPDSGEPHVVVSKVLQILDQKFGSKLNNKHFKVLNNVRVIQGDGINSESIDRILAHALQLRFSATNIAFGMGGALLQHHNRDTQMFAMKCSYIKADGKDIEVYKSPITDQAKSSKRGRLDLVDVTPIVGNDKQKSFQTVALGPNETTHPNSALKTVFENGVIYNETTLDEIRSRAKV